MTKKVDDAPSLQVGKHGLIIEFTDPDYNSRRSATYLPEVAAHEGTHPAHEDIIPGYGRGFRLPENQGRCCLFGVLTGCSPRLDEGGDDRLADAQGGLQRLHHRVAAQARSSDPLSEHALHHALQRLRRPREEGQRVSAGGERGEARLLNLLHHLISLRIQQRSLPEEEGAWGMCPAALLPPLI